MTERVKHMHGSERKKPWILPPAILPVTIKRLTFDGSNRKKSDLRSYPTFVTLIAPQICQRFGRK